MQPLSFGSNRIFSFKVPHSLTPDVSKMCSQPPEELKTKLDAIDPKAYIGGLWEPDGTGEGPQPSTLIISSSLPDHDLASDLRLVREVLFALPRLTSVNNNEVEEKGRVVSKAIQQMNSALAQASNNNDTLKTGFDLIA